MQLREFLEGQGGLVGAALRHLVDLHARGQVFHEQHEIVGVGVELGGEAARRLNVYGAAEVGVEKHFPGVVVQFHGQVPA